MNIFACFPLPPHLQSHLQKMAKDAIVHHRPDPTSRDLSCFNLCEVAFGNPPVDWLANSPSLKWVQLESVGFGEYAKLDWRNLARRVTVSNLAGFFAEPVAETIVAGILSHCRGITRLNALQDRKEWAGDALRPALSTLKGANVVLFGLGDINRRVRALLEPFGCTLTGFARSWRKAELENALSKADIVICTVPHTAETKGLFDHALIAHIKSGALFVNAGRGSLVDEEALADALESGALGGAVLDVTREEPLPSAHRFWTTRNLVLTQHTGGGTADEVARKVDFFLANFGRYRQGQTLMNVVDFERGY